ncbi:hypothetical protein QR680_003233 [Steinernema hermaphroditum]|uniref:Uncharacterized protein n=1 Tax=Steinernema hermaphroditum TaxID=289476 RepID=A0AA39LJP7_9BILA|nr:hypothetical protein QR680_003233 [Steinernema hermaphroditum]
MSHVPDADEMMKVNGWICTNQKSTHFQNDIRRYVHNMRKQTCRNRLHQLEMQYCMLMVNFSYHQEICVQRDFLDFVEAHPQLDDHGIKNGELAVAQVRAYFKRVRDKHTDRYLDVLTDACQSLIQKEHDDNAAIDEKSEEE